MWTATEIDFFCAQLVPWKHDRKASPGQAFHLGDGSRDAMASALHLLHRLLVEPTSEAALRRFGQDRFSALPGFLRHLRVHLTRSTELERADATRAMLTLVEPTLKKLLLVLDENAYLAMHADNARPSMYAAAKALHRRGFWPGEWPKTTTPESPSWHHAWDRLPGARNDSTHDAPLLPSEYWREIMVVLLELTYFNRERLNPRLNTRLADESADTSALGKRLNDGTASRPHRLSPASLLVARYQVVSFTGRERDLTYLQAWIEGESAARVLLVTGAGGTGKTRLLVEWVKQLRARDALAGFLGKQLDDATVQAVVTARSAVVVIDYAETRDGLVHLLEALTHVQSPQRIRVVLLARHGGDWWTSLAASSHEVAELLGESPPPYALAPLAHSLDERVRELDRAVACFAEVLDKPLPLRLPDVSDQRFERVLYIHMAGLAAVEGWEFESGRADGIIGSVLDHERRFLTQRAGVTVGTREGRAFVAAADAVIAAVTLRGGVARLADLRGYSRLAGAAADSLLEVLPDIYPEIHGGFSGPLEPDLLGETLVMQVLSKPTLIPDFLDAALEGAGRRELTQAFTVLSRISDVHPEQGTDWLRKALASDLPARALPAFDAAMAHGRRAAGGALGPLLADALEARGTLTEATTLSQTRIPESTLGLKRVALWVEYTLSEAIEGDPMQPLARATRLSELSLRQKALGDHAAAHRSATRAVALLRDLHLAAPDRPEFMDGLAVALLHLGSVRWRATPHDCLGTIQEAVALLAPRRSTQPRRWASGNNLLALILARFERYDEALEAIGHAIEARQRMPPFAETTHELAVNIHNRAAFLFRMGRYEDALAEVRHALALTEPLVQADPDAYLVGKVVRMTTLGRCLRRLARHSESATMLEDAVGLLRGLVRDARDSTTGERLVRCLGHLSDAYHMLGRLDDAVACVEEALRFQDSMPTTRSDYHLDRAALHGFGSWHLLALGRLDAALTYADHACAVFAEQLAGRSDLHYHNHLQSLSTRARILHALGRREDARSAAREALHASWPRFVRYPRAHLELVREVLDTCFATGLTHEVADHRTRFEAANDELAPKVTV